ncbi:MAG: DUF362 domain-containing protein [Candidatus Bathyarchaeia archaeon]
MGRVSIVRDLEDRRRGVAKALTLIEDEVVKRITGRARVVVKPNFVSAYSYLSATPVECVEETLKFLLRLANPREMIVAETPTIGSFREAIERFGYKALKDRYDVELCDLDGYGYEEVEIVDREGRPCFIPVSKLILESDFRVSAIRPKTHDVVVVTLSLKNMVVGSVKKGYRQLLHRGYWQINYNIARIAVYVMPHLAVADGYEAMEGDGPVNGSPRRWGVYFASTNPISLDSTVAYAMGFNAYDIGYLYILSLWGYGELDLNRIAFIGDPLSENIESFKPHRSFKDQLNWKRYMDDIIRLPKPPQLPHLRVEPYR